MGWRQSLIDALRRYARLYGRRRQRCLLMQLDDRLLADIGVSREQALREADKPFWQ
jgi:uncharacterized protein YjiS (DUF1127 family)